MSTLIYSVFLPKGGRLHSLSQRQTDSTVSCHSTFTHFALIQSLASIHFGNCCATSNPSKWHFQSKPEKYITLKHPKPSFEKQSKTSRSFSAVQVHSFVATCILKANQSARFCLSNEITLVHGKFLTVQTVRIDLNWMHLPIHACLITKLTRWHCHSQNNRNYGNDAFKFKPCDCFPKAAESSLSTKENIFVVI